MDFVSTLNAQAETFIPAAKRMKVSHQGGASSSHTTISPDEPAYINTFKPGSYFSSYKRVTSKREIEEWSDHADLEPFKWHDPSNPCPCLEHWRRPPIILGYSHSPPATCNDVFKESTSDESWAASYIDGEDLRSSEEDDSDDSTESIVSRRLYGMNSVRKLNRSRAVRRLSRGIEAKGMETNDEFLDPSLWKGLHDELVLQIFAKLPFRSLSRLRTVCKGWNSVIYNREFRQLRPRLPVEAPFCVVFDHLVQGYSIFNPSSHTWYRLSRSFFSFSAKKACLLAAAGGLCLFEGFGYPERTLFVVNPMNKSERKLPPMVGNRNLDELLYVEMMMNREADLFMIIAVVSILYPDEDIDDEDEDIDFDEDTAPENFHVHLSFQVYNSKMNSWDTRIVAVDEKFKDILSTVMYDGELYCLIRTLDNRHIVYMMGKGADDHDGFDRKLGEVMQLSEFDNMLFVHLFEQKGQLMICGKSRLVPGLGVRLWLLDGQTLHWREVQRIPKKLRSNFSKLGWRSRVAVHGNYMWISGIRKELVMANIASKSWCLVPDYTLGCSQDFSWNPNCKRRSSRYRCTLFLFEPRLDLVV